MNQPKERSVVSLSEDNVLASEKKRPGEATHGAGHSDIFERLSADQDTDLVGLVAYGLYQRRKRAWMKAFKEENSRFPSFEERDAFAFGHREDALTALRSEAENALATFSEEVINQQIDEIRRDALGAETQAVLSGIDTKIGQLGGYRHHVIGHLVAFVILIGIVAFGTLAVNFEPTIAGAYHWVFGSGEKK